ncbi:MAG: AmmeMemoRadiSam system radical SAM enzyme [Planctomycetes bacterium]|nr:AmmeMemoRadiSam system radical SAM enzyme [Planctomycetota bacterium]
MNNIKSCSRRQFIENIGQFGLAISAMPAMIDVLFGSGRSVFAQDDTGKFIEVKHYKKLPDNAIQCFVCPLDCILLDGQTCFCRTRTNHGGILYNHAYNNPCIINVDPIEKLPLYHFLPSTKSLGIATGGCNMRCLYCQNWQESQEIPDKLKNFSMTAEKLLDSAAKKELKSICYSYTEPVSYYEYMMEISAHAHSKGIKNAVCTAAFIKKDPLKELCKTADAFTVTLKGIDQEFYDKICGSKIAPVLDAIKTIKEEKVWLEIAHLIVPTYNDSPEKTKELCKWVKENAGEDTPLHLLRFFPEYKMKDVPQTPVNVITKAREIALDAGLKYVYVSNVSPHDGNNTYCQNCKKPVIKRLGVAVLENSTDKGKCKFCGTQLPGVYV